jgi:hypothetical protein
VAIVDSGVYFVPVRKGGRGSSLQFLSFATNQIKTVGRFEQPLDLGEMGGLAVSRTASGSFTRRSEQAERADVGRELPPEFWNFSPLLVLTK